VRRLPQPPGARVRRHDTLLTRSSTLKTTSDVPPAYASEWGDDEER
jgi:hypothetical protein